LIRDLDSNFGPGFDGGLASEFVEVIRVGPRKPTLHALYEWVLQNDSARVP